MFSFCKKKVIGWLGGKYDDILRKSANIRGKRWGKKEEIFTVPRGRNIIYGKGGQGQKYDILGKYSPLDFTKEVE